MTESSYLLKEKVHLCSSSKVVVYSFEWTIENFSFYGYSQDKAASICSTLFETEDNNYSWLLELYRHGYSYIPLVLKNMSQNKNFNAKAKVVLLDSSSSQNSCDFLIKPGESSSQFRLNDPDYLPNDCLTILCEIQVLEKESALTYEGNRETVTLSDDLSNLLKSNNSSDVTLLVGEKEFKVHKTILAARSSVFAAMFAHNFKEKCTNIVKIVDVLPTIMEKVIHYIYTDKFPNLKKHAEEVLPVSEKYALLGLKSMCADQLYSQLSVDNAAHILLLADKYNVASLKEYTINLMVNNSKSVVTTPSWIKIEDKKHPLVSEVALAAFRKLHIRENIKRKKRSFHITNDTLYFFLSQILKHITPLFYAS